MTVLKRWRYVGVYGPDLMCCFGVVSIGGLPQRFWAVWDREQRVLRERTRLRPGAVSLSPGRVRVRDRGVAIDLCCDEDAATPIEVTSSHGGGEIWTRKRIARFTGTVVIDGSARTLDAHGIVDDSAGRHARHTAWSWSAGVGTAEGGGAVAWNLVTGLHDGEHGSERAVWHDGVPAEAPPVRFDDALTEVAAVDGSFALRCDIEATRSRTDDLLVVSSRYEQPFGTFSGNLPGGIALAEGYGVMERHEARW